MFPDKPTRKKKGAGDIPEKFSTLSQIDQRKWRKLMPISILEVKEQEGEAQIENGVGDDHIFLSDF
jgi:hypothetical protein